MAKKDELQDLKELVAPYLEEWRSRSPNENAAFRDWAVSQVLWDEDLSWEQIQDITAIDRPGELGLDGWYYASENDPPTLFLFQAKNTRAKPQDLSWMKEGFVSAFGHGASVANTDAKALASDFQVHFREGTVIEFHLVTSEFATNPLLAHAAEMQGNLRLFERDIPFRAFVHDLNDLVSELKVVRNDEIDALIEIGTTDHFEMWTSGTFHTVAAAVPALTLAHLFREHRTNLFRLNPRYYLSTRGAVNSDMLKTLRGGDRKNFYLYNNGVTAVCDGIEVQASKGQARIRARNFQIVNGCQTTATLYKAWEQGAGDAELAGVQVLLRIIESPSPVIARQIRERTNAQNPMKAEDERANDPRQEKLKDGFDRLTPPWFYEHKRGVWITDYPKKTDRVRYARPDGGWRHIAMKDLAQACLAFQGNPAKSVEGPRFVFQSEKEYSGVFSDTAQAAQLLLPYLLFEQASTLIATTPTPDFAGATYLRYPLVAVTSRVIHEWLGQPGLGYFPRTTSETLNATVGEWAPDILKVAHTHLVKVAKASNVGARSVVRRADWLEEPTEQILETLRGRLADQADLARQMGVPPETAGLRAKFPLPVRD